MSNRRRHTGSRANPDPNTCLGVFGLSLYTTERDLREVFSRYGPLTGVNVVYDQRTGRSRGFAFVYFERIDDSKEVSGRNTCPSYQTSIFLPERWNTRTAWSWMAAESAWITPSPSERTRPPRGSTWADPHTVEVAVVEEQVGVAIPTMTEGTTEDMIDMKNMITGDDHLHLIIAAIDRDQDPVHIAQDATEDQKRCS
ncbi:transformer-2 protein homolog alpha isoform X2 [Alligator sinensis]|uniref:Transformer-2 protein homolog alpha isoform X2 n=1 Tax=Alligator sinensis TaxID=38654 RepID=A0A3Q0GVV5_ALLSI|nr:transformer-2 protein homolog alpha isoform X2 [Alligator sinensis]